MMDYKLLTSQFKAKHLQAGNQLDFSLLPLLVEELIEKGLNVSHVSGKFYQELAEELFKQRQLQLYAVEALFLLGQSIPLPKQVEQPIAAPKTEEIKKVKKFEDAAVIDGIIITEHLVNNIPSEDEEGDPLYTAPEDRINLRPEDFKPKEYDEDFCARIGATKDRR